MDRAAFDVALEAIKSDANVKQAEVIAIAHRYVGGGKKPATRTAAIAAVGRHFVDLIRSNAKNKIAEKVRPW